ncbi:MAG: FecCD family ABC transporter permease [Vagococcus sp.]
MGPTKSSAFILFSSLLVLIVLTFLFAVSNGQADISLLDVGKVISNQLYLAHDPYTISDSSSNIIWHIRFPRVITAFFAGSALSVAGVIMQALVQNPLADPYMLGISSGASLGATFSILIGFGTTSFLAQFGTTFSAFIGALLATVMILFLSNIGTGGISSVKLILSGIIINSLLSSLSSLIIVFANNTEGIKTLTFWSMGSLASSSWEKIPLLGCLTVTITLFFMTQIKWLDMMLLGTETAITLGASLGKLRVIYLILSSLLTAIVVANCGMIGFVGLVVPHIVRSFFGSQHHYLLPASFLLGGLFLMLADLFARTISNSVELPIGVVTAIIGAPFFAYIMIKRDYQFGGE